MYVTIKERKLIQDSSVVLHNVVVEVDPQVFEVANVEESDVVFEDAQVDVCDVLQLLNGINSPFHTKDSIISVNIAHLNFRALIDTGDALPIKSQCRNISRISNQF